LLALAAVTKEAVSRHFLKDRRSNVCFPRIGKAREQGGGLIAATLPGIFFVPQSFVLILRLLGSGRSSRALEGLKPKAEEV
jgi:hypothetical protein